MNRTILARPAPRPGIRQPNDSMPAKPGRSHRGEPGWSPPSTRGPATAVRRFRGRLFGNDADRHACWCIRCTLHRLGIWRREHVRYGRSAWVRTTVFGVRIRPDRCAFPLDEQR